MLYMLCARSDGFSRAELAELLWAKGKVGSVRQELSNLRRLPGAETWLEAGDPVVVRSECDVREFRLAMAERRYAESIALYRGDFLADVEAPGSPVFTDWLHLERYELEDALREALQKQASKLEAAVDYQAALELTERRLALDPLDETAHRTIMRLYYKLGNSTAALDAFAECHRILKAELGAEPLAETLELREFIRAELERTSKPAERVLRGVDESIASLTALSLHLARSMTLLDHDVPVSLLSRIIEASEAEVTSAFSELARFDLLDNRRISTATRRALLESMPESVRLHLHARIASALAHGSESPAVVARHLLLAHLHEQAVAPLLAAAEEAAKALDGAAARAHLLHALLACADRHRKVTVLLRLERLLRQQSLPELLDAVIDQLEQLAFELQDDEVLIEALLCRAYQQLAVGELSRVITLAEDAIDAARRIDRHELAARGWNVLGGARYHLGDLDAAREAFTIAASQGADTEKLRAYNNLGTISGIRGDLTEALGFQEQALTIARHMNDHRLTAGILHNIGATAERQAGYDKAARSFAESARLFEAIGDHFGQGTVQANVAILLLRQGKPDEAACNIERLDELAKQTGSKLLALRHSFALGMWFDLTGAPQQSLMTYDLAYSQAGELGDDRLKAQMAFNVERVRLQLDPDRDPAPAVAALRAMEQMKLLDTIPWAWAELGGLIKDAGQVREWAEQLVGMAHNPHLVRLGTELAARADALEASGSDRLEPE